MKNLEDFATEAWPLHPSGAGALLLCNWRIVSTFLTEPTDEGGAAGDTGSALHAAVAAFHKGIGVAASLQVMQTGKDKYPQADLSDAAGMFLSYTADSRNVNAKVILTEEPIKFSIAPAPEDHTKKDIQIEGTTDQVREEPDGLHVLDIKSSKKEAISLLNLHTFQQALYAVGVGIKLGRPVVRAKLVLTRKYAGKEPSNAPVFWSYPWQWKDLPDIVEGIRHMVAAVRAGRIFHFPHEACNWCHHRSPDLCLPKLQELRKTLRS